MSGETTRSTPNDIWTAVILIAVLIAIGTAAITCDVADKSGPATTARTVRPAETEPKAKNIPPQVTVDYKIEVDESLAGIKGTLVIRLPEEVSEYELGRIAMELRLDGRGHFERLFITYYLPGMQVGAGAWATTNFNPDLKVQVWGR